MGCLGSLFIGRSDSWHSIVEVRREDGLETVDHEERRVAGGLAGNCPQAPEHHRELGDPTRAKLIQLVEDPRLEALKEHAICALNLPIRSGVRDGGPIDPDVSFIAESKEFLAGELCAELV